MNDPVNNTGALPNQTDPKPSGRKLPWILLLAFITSLILGAAGFVIATERGLQWAFSALVRNIPGELSVDHLEGRLIGPLAIRGLRYHTADKNITLSIDTIEADIRPLALLYERVHISRLDITGVSYIHTASEVPLTTLPDIQFPLGITLDQASITHITVSLPDLNQSYPIDRITLKGKTLFGRLQIDSAVIASPSFQTRIRGTLTPKNVYSLNLSMNWSVFPQDYPVISGQTILTGNLVKELTIAQSVNAPLKATLHGSVKNMLTAMEWQANLALDKTNINSINKHWPIIDIGGKLHVTAPANSQSSKNRIIVESTLQFTHQKNTLNTTARANFSDNQWHIEQATLALPDKLARVIFKGDLGSGLIPATDQPWQLTGRWHDLAWPLDTISQAAVKPSEGKQLPKNTSTVVTSVAVNGVRKAAAIVSKEGNFNLTGNLDAYKFTLDGNIAGATFPSGRWTAAGEGTREGLVLNTIQADILEGHITGDGELYWELPSCTEASLPRETECRKQSGLTPKTKTTAIGATSTPEDRQISWAVNFTGSGLNPGQYWPAWPGQLSLQAHIGSAKNLNSAENYSVITLEISDLKGQLRNVPLTGNASLIIDQDTYVLSSFTLASGSSQLNASGTLNETWDMQWDVDIKNIGDLPTNTRFKQSGTLKGDGSLTGSREQPRISAKLQGKTLMVDTYRADELNLMVDVDTQSQQASQFDLLANGITIANQSIESLVIKGRGQAQNHVVDATLKSSGKTLVLRAEGALGESIGALNNPPTATTFWKGQLTQANITLPTLGYWPLTTPGILTVTTDHAQLGPLCWAQQTAQMCFDATRTAKTGWQANARATHMPASFLQSFLSAQTIVAGIFDATATVYMNPAGVITGTAKFIPEPGAIVHPLGEDQNLVLAYTQGLVEATLNSDTLNTHATLTLTDRGTVGSTLLLPRSALPAFLANPASQASQIKGQLNADIRDLSLLPDFFPEIEDTQGKVNIALTVDGTPEQPRFSGYAKLEQGSALVPRLGLRLRDIQIQATGTNDNHLSLTAQAQSGKGVLHVRGTLRPGNTGGDVIGQGKSWGADLTVQGEHFEAIRTPDIQATVSPTLTVKVASNVVDVNGSLIIPDANIQLRDLTTAQHPSSDVIIIAADKKNSSGQEINSQGSASKRWVINSIIGLQLGDNVKFKGVGLSGRFTGDLALIDSPQQLTTAYGEIRIEDGGEYRAVNQKLEVKKGGRLVFAGGPINNPGIDARAARQINTNVRVGFNVRGTLQSPQLSVYSEPSMAETDALAYLLFGRPMNQATTAEGNQMAAAAAGLGAASGEFLMKKIGNTFGIEDIRVETGTVASTTGIKTQQATVVLGKYLSPKLYITYGVGIVDRINTLRLRYQLGRHWTIEAESGLHQGADLLYTIDKK